MKRIPLLISLVVAAACTPEAGPSSPVPGDSVSVVQVLDGDSLVVEGAGAQTEVRLLGINAPERDECYDDAARSRLAELANDEVQLAGAEEDRFGRALRYVIDSTGTVLNQRLVADAAL